MIKSFAVKLSEMVKKAASCSVLLLAVPQSGAGWRAGPGKRVNWTSPFSVALKALSAVAVMILELKASILSMFEQPSHTAITHEH